MKPKAVLLSLAFIFITSLSWAVANPESVIITPNSGLRDILLYAEKNNAGLESSHANLRGLERRIPQAHSLEDPMLNLNTTAVENQDSPKEYRFGLSQKFPWFGKRGVKRQIEEEKSQAAGEELEGRRLALFNRVKQAYYEYYYIDQAIKITEENQKILSYFEEIARTKYSVGQAPQQNVLKAQVEFEKLSNELLTLRYLREALTAELNAAMNRPPGSYVPPPMAPKENKFILTDAEILAKVHKNPQLNALNHMAESEGQRLKLAEKDYYPDFDLELAYTRSYMFDRDMRNQYMVGVSINIPLQLERRQAAKEEAMFGRQMNLDQRREMENEIKSRVKYLLSQFRDAQRRIALYNDSLIPKARQTLEVTQSAYITGNRAGFLDLLDDQRTLLEFTLAKLRAVTDYEQRLAEIEMLAGQAPAELNSESQP